MSLSVKKFSYPKSTSPTKVEFNIRHRRGLSCSKWSKLALRESRVSPSRSQIFKLGKIEKELYLNLHELATKEPITIEKFSVYKDSFDKIVEITGSSLLKHIKSAYDAFISSKLEELEEKRVSLEGLEKALKEERGMFKQLNKRFKMLALDNLDLNHQISDLHKVEMPPEDGNQAKLNKALQKYRHMKLSHAKLVKLLDIIREKGVPVDEIFDKEVNSKHQLWLEVPSYQDTSSAKEPTLKLDDCSPQIGSFDTFEFPVPSQCTDINDP